MAQNSETRRPKVAAMLRGGLEDCLTVLDFPEGHRRRLGSTNMLERHEKWQLESRPYFSMENADLEALGPAVRQAA